MTEESTMTQIYVIVSCDIKNDDESEAALIELAKSLGIFFANGAGPPSFFNFATVLSANQRKSPHIDSGASTTFVTRGDYLIKPRKHRTRIATANGKCSSTQRCGKFKLTETQ